MEKSKTTTIPISIEQAWNLVTDARKFHGLKLPGIYREFNRNAARKGTIIEASSVFGGGWFNYYIVDFDKPHKFSFGGVGSYIFMFELSKINSQTTELRFKRRFKKLSWFEWLFKRKSNLETCQYLLNATIEEIEYAAQNISTGNDDGVYQSPNY